MRCCWRRCRGRRYMLASCWATSIFTLIVGLVLLPLMTVLYGLDLLNGWVIITTVVGIFGFATIGTLLATLTVQTRAREALLPIAMLPIVLPFLLTAVRATKGILSGAPAAEWQGPLGMLGGHLRDLSGAVPAALRICAGRVKNRAQRIAGISAKSTGKYRFHW